MANNILIAGVCTPRGIKVAKFLTRKGYNVYGVDRHQPVENLVKKFFRMDMRHQDNMELIMTIVKPTTLIFCPEAVSNTNNSYISFSGVLMSALKNGVRRVALCLDNLPDKPTNPEEISQNAMYQLLDVFKDEYQLETCVVTDKENLLKEIKEFVKIEGGEQNDISKKT